MVLYSYHLPPFVHSPFSSDVFPFDQWSAMHPVNQSVVYPTNQSQTQVPLQGTPISPASFGFPTAQLNYIGHYMEQIPLNVINRPTQKYDPAHQLEGLNPQYFSRYREDSPHIGFDPVHLLAVNKEMRWRPQPDIMYREGFFR